MKLADFGTSKFQPNSHYVTPKLGTRAYMAPEILTTIKGDNNGIKTYQGYTWKADVYSFGITCSEILTGKRPFNRYPLGGERPPLPDSIPSSLKSLIEDCWNTDPKKRPDVWEIRERLWQCRLDLQFRDDAQTPPSSWECFVTRLNG